MNSEKELLYASKYGNLDMVKYLIESGINIDTFDYQTGFTPLTWAVSNGDMNMIKYLVENGADVNKLDMYDRNVLMISIDEDNYTEISKYLVDHGVDINFPSYTGQTSLMVAIWNRNLELVKYLLENGANMYVTNSFGETPWIVAVRREYKPTIDYLIKIESNKLKEELIQNYLSVKGVSPKYNIYTLIPKNIILNIIYKTIYQESCSNISAKIPPLKLVALGYILKMDYNIDIDWLDLCKKVKQTLYLLL